MSCNASVAGTLHDNSVTLMITDSCHFHLQPYGTFRLGMNERLVIGGCCCLNLTPTFAAGDGVVARVLRGTKVFYGRSSECSPAIAAAAAAHCATRPRQRDRRRGERSAAQVPAGSAVQLCNDLLEDRMHEEVWREVYPQFLTFKILVPWVKSTATSTAESSRRAQIMPGILIVWMGVSACKVGSKIDA